MAGADGPDVLLDLARACDVVFVGADEAETSWGVGGGPDAVRALLPEPGVLVVKEGGRGATVFASATAPAVFVPALDVDVVAATR